MGEGGYEYVCFWFGELFLRANLMRAVFTYVCLAGCFGLCMCGFVCVCDVWQYASVRACLC